MKKSKYTISALDQDSLPKGIPYIIGNELAERFSYYGMRAILMVFMTKYLIDSSGQLAPMNPSEAKTYYHLFISISYLTSCLGAFLADVFFGKYNVIIWLSIVYCLGHFALALDETRLGLGIGLVLISLGAGGIKPCVSAHVGDQFGKKNAHLLSKVFGWFYFSINLGATASMILTPLLLAKFGPGVAFGIPGLLMALATLFFWMGRYTFVHIPPQPKKIFSALKDKTIKSNLLKLTGMYGFVAFFWSLFDQTGSSWILQAEQMDRHLFGINWLSSQIQAFNSLLLLALIPLFYYVIYPFIEKRVSFSPLSRIFVGLLLAGSSFIVIGLAQQFIDLGLSISIIWQIAAYSLLTVGEVMVSITALEFAYTQAPKSLKSLVMCLYLVSVSVGNIFTSGINALIKVPFLTPWLTGSNYFYFFSILVFIVSAGFYFYKKSYKANYVLQD